MSVFFVPVPSVDRVVWASDDLTYPVISEDAQEHLGRAWTNIKPTPCEGLYLKPHLYYA